MKTISVRFLPVLISFILSAGICNPAIGQAQSETSSKLDSLYRSRSYEVLENYVLRSLLNADTLSVFNKAALHKYLGIVYILQGRKQEGKQAFIRWLMIDRNGYIDNYRFPPEVVEVFKEAKSESDNRIEEYPVLALQQWKPTLSGTLKSLCVPGWGQIEKGNTSKGVLIFAAQALTSAGWLVAENNFDIANKTYYRETDPGQFDEKYDRVNSWYKAKGTFLIASIGVYVFAQTDFLFFPQFTTDVGHQFIYFTCKPSFSTSPENINLHFMTISLDF